MGQEHPNRHDLTSLQVLGTVGEPINPEAWMWYHRVIGHERCPIVDTWWQTETGGHMITPLPCATPTVPGSCTLPAIGVDAAIVDQDGQEVPHGTGGLLAIRQPWPGMLRGIYGDRERFIDTYWSRLPGLYFAGDGARRDECGYFWIMGRVDDVINGSGPPHGHHGESRKCFGFASRRRGSGGRGHAPRNQGHGDRRVLHFGPTHRQPKTNRTVRP